MGQALAAIFFDGFPGLRAEAGSRPGGRGTCSLLRQRKVPKRKATPSLRPLRGAKGQTCGVSVAGCAVELTALLCSFVQATTASQFTMHGRCDAHAHPATVPTQAQPAGVGSPHGPSLCSAPVRGRKRLALRSPGRAQRRPVGLFGCLGCPAPSGCACGGVVAGWHARRSAHASSTDSPWLSERRAQRKASSTAHPATAPTQVCPVAKRRGRRLGGAFSLLTFFWRSKRK